jgi:hypothetical protein
MDCSVVEVAPVLYGGGARPGSSPWYWYCSPVEIDPARLDTANRPEKRMRRRGWREKGWRGGGALALADVGIWRGRGGGGITCKLGLLPRSRPVGEESDHRLDTEQYRGRGLVFREGSREV